MKPILPNLIFCLLLSPFTAHGLNFTVGTSPESDGPNCHNTALIKAGIMQVQRYVSGDEMDFWLKQYCSEIPSGSTIKPNDLRVMRIWRLGGSRLDYWHTQVFLDSETIFEKPGYAHWEKFRVVPYSMVGRSKLDGAKWSDAKRTQECNWANGTPDSCYMFANHYRCSSQQYRTDLRANRSAIKEELGADFLDKLGALEKETTDAVQGYYLFSLAGELVAKTQPLLEALSKVNGRSSNIDPRVLQILEFRVNGIIGQMEMKPTPLTRSPVQQEL